MKLSRTARLAPIVLLAAASFTACGSDTEDTASPQNSAVVGDSTEVTCQKFHEINEQYNVENYQDADPAEVQEQLMAGLDAFDDVASAAENQELGRAILTISDVMRSAADSTAGDVEAMDDLVESDAVQDQMHDAVSLVEETCGD